jgi:hypothetical protein
MINWPPIPNFSNLEELRFSMWGADGPSPHLLMRSVVSPCLRRVILEIGTEIVRRPPFESLADLARRHKTCRNLVFQISTKADPEKVRGMLPQAVQAGIVEVGLSERPYDWA